MCYAAFFLALSFAHVALCAAAMVTQVYVLKRSVCLAPYVGDWRPVRLSTLI